MNLYQILGVPRDASQQEIKRAYYGLARKTHPDYYGDAYLSTFKKICLAYEILSNSQRRAVYDQHIRPPASMLDLLNTEAGKKLLSVILPHAPAARREGEDLLVVLEETDNGCVELSDPLCLDQALRIPIGTSHVFCRVAHRGAPGHGGGAAGRLFILPTRTRKKKG